MVVQPYLEAVSLSVLDSASYAQAAGPSADYRHRKTPPTHFSVAYSAGKLRRRQGVRKVRDPRTQLEIAAADVAGCRPSPVYDRNRSLGRLLRL